MVFKDKKILIISPQAWGKMFVSKHHYAVELANLGNTVYFLNPMNHGFKDWLKIEEPKDLKNLRIVTSKAFFPLILRFHLRWLFDLLMSVQLKRIIKKLKINFDIIWCFNPYYLSTFKIFKSKINIYHIVDPILNKYEFKPSASANLVLSVSKIILKGLKRYNEHCFLINHGVGDKFIEYGRRVLERDSFKITSDRIKVGYVGNLFMECIDRVVFKRIIEENPAIEFVFWGPISLCDCNVGAWKSNESNDFLKFLKSQNNVTLKGAKVPDVLAGEIQEMNAFIFCYKINNKHNECLNAHKILEYLSTGKVIISTYVLEYKDRSELVEMLKDGNNEILPDLFKKTIDNLTLHNSPGLQRKRIEFALDNSYFKQIKRIEQLL